MSGQGLVVKGLAEPYRGGHLRVVKFRIRDTVEAIAAAVTGTLADPDRHILGLPGPSGERVVAGARPR